MICKIAFNNQKLVQFKYKLVLAVNRGKPKWLLHHDQMFSERSLKKLLKSIAVEKAL